jgi:sulfite exporter TauE/SafE
MELLTGFFLGFLGSFHCIGMAAVSLALPQGGKFYGQDAIIGSDCHGGLGLVLGFIGSRFNLAGAQQIVSISLGVLVILTVIAPVKVKTKFVSISGFDKALLVLKKNMSTFYRSNNLTANLGAGILNGFLPCGFVYMALSGALIVGNANDSSFFMMMFGLGLFHHDCRISGGKNYLS